MSRSDRNALTTNTYWCDGAARPFPVAIDLATVDGVTRSWFCPMEHRDLADLIAHEAQRYLLLLDVDHYHVQDDRPEAQPLAEVLPGYGVTPCAHDSDAVVIASSDFPVLFGEFQAYNLVAVDLAEIPPDIASLWVELRGRPDTDEPRLPLSPSSGLLLDTHDDCFVLIEEKQPHVGVALAQRMLVNLASTAAARVGFELDVAPPEAELVERLVGAEGRFVCRQEEVEVTADLVRIPFGRANWRMPHPPPPTHVVTYDARAGSWLEPTVRRAR